MSRNRLLRELKDAKNLKEIAVINGPLDSPCYSGSRFVLGILCDSSYPFQAPKIWFKTKVRFYSFLNLFSIPILLKYFLDFPP